MFQFATIDGKDAGTVTQPQGTLKVVSKLGLGTRFGDWESRELKNPPVRIKNTNVQKRRLMEIFIS